MRSFKHKATLASLIGLMALIVAACGTSSSGGTGTTPTGNGYSYAYKYTTPTHKGGTIVIGDWQTPDSVNAFSSVLDPTVVNQDVFNAMWGSCVSQLPDLSLKAAGWVPDECTVVPTVANGGESADLMTTTIHIDPKAAWSDGQPMVAADFLMYWDMIADPNVGGLSASPPYDKLKMSAPDDHTIVYNWNVPVAAYLYDILGSEPAHAFSKVFNAATSTYDTKAAQKIVNDPTFLNNPPVNGPFAPQSYGTGGTTVVMVPNTHYFSNYFHATVADKLIFQAAGTKDALIQAFKAGGTYQQVEDFTVADLPKFNGIDPTQLVQSPAFEYEHLQMNQRAVAPNAKANGGTSIFVDPLVRKAFAESIDKCRILVGILGVSCTDPAYQTGEITAPVDPAYDSSITTAAFNPAQGATDMTQAGYKLDAGGLRTYKDGKTEINLQLDTTKGNLVRNSSLTLFQQQLQGNLGVQTTINEDTGKLFGSFDSGGWLSTGNFDIAEFAFSSSANSDSLTNTITTGDIPSKTNKGGQNYSGVSDPAIENFLKDARGNTNAAAALKDYHDLYAKVSQDNDYIPLYARPNISLVTTATLGNYKQSPVNIGNTWNIQEWYLTQ